MDQNFYYSLGRLVICPKCGSYSDLSIDQQKMPPDDVVSLEQMLESRKVCRAFHMDPVVAWLWFKYHKTHEMREYPSVDKQALINQATRDYRKDPPEDWEVPVGAI